MERSRAAGFRIFYPNWPTKSTHTGSRIAEALTKPGVLRHDMMIETNVCGHVIGSKGSKHREISERTGCNLFIISDEPPPEHPDLRLIVLVGSPNSINDAQDLILQTAETAAAPAHHAPRGAPSRAASSGRLPPRTDQPPDPNSPFTHIFNWPLGCEAAGPNANKLYRSSAEIKQAMSRPGSIRHDMLIDKSAMGRIIGPGGNTYRQLQERTGCTVVICDFDSPPGESADVRLVSFIGSMMQVSTAVVEVESVVQKLVPSSGLQVNTGMGGGGTTIGAVSPDVGLPSTGSKGFCLGGTCVTLGADSSAGVAAPSSERDVINVEPLAEFKKMFGDWPSPLQPDSFGMGAKIQAAESRPGNVRHDLILDKVFMAMIIGAGGLKYKAMQRKTGCEMFIIDRESPPNYPADARLIALVGTRNAVSACARDVAQIVDAHHDTVFYRSNGRIFESIGLPSSTGGATTLAHDQQVLSEFVSRPDGWPVASDYKNKGHIIASAMKAGTVRHDIQFPAEYCARLIGKGGDAHKELQRSTGCRVFILDQSPPPDVDPSLRIAVLVGTPIQVTLAAKKIDSFMETLVDVPSKKRSEPEGGFGHLEMDSEMATSGGAPGVTYGFGGVIGVGFGGDHGLGNFGMGDANRGGLGTGSGASANGAFGGQFVSSWDASKGDDFGAALGGTAAVSGDAPAFFGIDYSK